MAAGIQPLIYLIRGAACDLLLQAGVTAPTLQRSSRELSTAWATPSYRCTIHYLRPFVCQGQGHYLGGGCGLRLSAPPLGLSHHTPLPGLHSMTAEITTLTRQGQIDTPCFDVYRCVWTR